MRYKVVETTEDTVTIWDGKAMDPDHPGEPAGQMTLDMQFHGCRKDDLVELHLRIISTAPATDAERIEQRLADGVGRRLGATIYPGKTCDGEDVHDAHPWTYVRTIQTGENSAGYATFQPGPSEDYWCPGVTGS